MNDMMTCPKPPSGAWVVPDPEGPTWERPCSWAAHLPGRASSRMVRSSHAFSWVNQSVRWSSLMWRCVGMMVQCRHAHLRNTW